MIHIIDPRTQSPLPDLTLWAGKRRRALLPIRWINDRNLFSAQLVALREPSGLYRIIKARWHRMPKQPVRRATLKGMVTETMDRAET